MEKVREIASRAITFESRAGETASQPLQSPVQKWRWPTLKLSTRDFSPPPAVYRPRETAFFAVKPVASLCHSPLGRLHLRPRPRPRPRSFSRGTFPRAHQSATNTRDGFALPSAIPASVPRRYVMARLACLERERGSHT